MGQGIAQKRPKRRDRKRLQVRPGQAGHEGQFELGARVVDDPYERGAKLTATINVRHDVLTHWQARRMIDPAQYEAGRRFQAIYERAEIGAAGAIRYDKPRVDGGYPVDPLTDTVMEARREMQELETYLGRMDYALLVRVVGHGKPLEEEGASGEWRGPDPQGYAGRRVRDALVLLAGFWGACGKDWLPIRADRTAC